MDFFVCSCLLIYLFLYKFEFIFLEAYFILIFYLVLHIMLFQYFSMMSQGLSIGYTRLLLYTYTSDALLGFLCIVTVQHCWLCYANDSLCYDVNKLSFVHFIKWTDITVTAVLNILVTLSPVMWCCIVVIVVLFHSFVLYLHPSLQCSIL